ncbi:MULTISPECIES: XRE family transcriptional regulator [Streptomyces]|uniref:helix-turn-helix domain-containing protein n=1 Tax=Streptomyces TaxID=1883 RepID=UPI00386DA10F
MRESAFTRCAIGGGRSLCSTGESQMDLAAALGVSQAQVSRRQSGTAAWNLADCDAVAAHHGMIPLDLLAGPEPSRCRHRLTSAPT